MSIACKDCVTGSLHPGAPSGHEETLHGFPTYIASPPAELFPSGPTATVVIISDAFGWILPNARLLADRYARRAGWRVLLPDFLNGTSLDAALLEDIVIVAGNKTGILGKLLPGLRAISAMIPFIYLNRPAIARPRIISFFRALRISSSSSPTTTTTTTTTNTTNTTTTTTTTTTTPIGAIGFCWGGKYAIQLCANLTSDRDPSLPSQPLINAAFTAHPSNVLIPDEIAAVELPLSISVGSEDFALKMEGVEKIKEILKGKEKDEGDQKRKVRTEVVVVEGAKHGFAIRGNKASEDQLKQEEVAFEQAVSWLGSRLGEVGGRE